jgi:hypothetical protein
MYIAVACPAIAQCLAIDASGNGLSWPQRGWLNEMCLRREIIAGLSTRSSYTHGIVVARAQTREEANHVCRRLIQCSVLLIIILI